MGAMTTSSPKPKQLTPGTILPTLLIVTTLKILLIPSYYSTDFSVHRNWLAITKHLPINEWYFDDINGRTVHTLDYPPGFAWFEYFLSNNFVTCGLVSGGWLDERCLELLPDDDNEPSERCVKFQRWTVILSDAVFFLGAYLVSNSFRALKVLKGVDSKEAARLVFFLIVTNPGLLILDHIHFQYNGMLIGILLCSIACILRGAQTQQLNGHKKNEKLIGSNQMWELFGAASFAILLSMKHLYMTLAPLYLVYLLRHHCFVGRREKTSSLMTLQFSVSRFVPLAVVTLMCVLGPFVPFLTQQNPMVQMEQILKRLFPFGRGLVHDYWAANIWALYLFISRIASFFIRKSFIPSSVRTKLESYSLVPFPEPPPHIVALCLLVGLVPALICAWKAAGRPLAERLSGSGAKIDVASFFVHAVVFSSFSAFMLGYHVHEKAILTAIIPLTLLAPTSHENARLFIRTCMFGLFGLFPLLYQPEELLIKSSLFFTWMLIAVYALESLLFKVDKDTLLTRIDTVSITVLAWVYLFMEIIHPIVFMPSGKLEFLPLMATSVACSIGLLYCWFESGLQMMNCLKTKTKQN